MLTTKQIVITKDNKNQFGNFTNGWSSNILEAPVYEITIGSEAGNRFLIDNAVEPYTITATKIEAGEADALLSPISIRKFIRSIKFAEDNTYDNIATVITVLEESPDTLDAKLSWDDTFLYSEVV